MQINMDCFVTGNIRLVAFLLLNGRVPKAQPVAENPKKAEFVFEQDDRLTELVAAFFDGSARTEPARFTQALDQAYDMARAALRDERGW